MKHSPITILRFHVARLAKAYQVANIIRLLQRRKLSERFDVMHRNRISDNLATVLACAMIADNSQFARCKPLAPAISGRATNPERGVFARFVLMPVLVTARIRTILGRMAVSPEFIWKKLEHFTAVYAGVLCSGNCTQAFELTGLETPAVRFWRWPDSVKPFGIVDAKTFPRTILSRSLALHLTIQKVEMIPAYLARKLFPFLFVAHARIIPRISGSGTTAKVAIELGRRAIGLELNRKYIELSHERTETTIGMQL